MGQQCTHPRDVWDVAIDDDGGPYCLEFLLGNFLERLSNAVIYQRVSN